MSLVNQSYENFEVILIDDGSVDSSSLICKKITQLDCRFKYWYKNNGGVSSARNLGLSKAKGDWLTFIDADDYVSSDFIKNFEEASKENNDIVIDSHQLLYENGKIEEISHKSFTANYPDLSSVFRIGNLHQRTAPWGKLYKREIISNNNIFFNEQINHGEDAIFLFNYLLFCNSIRFINHNSYIYRFDRKESLTKRLNSTDSELLAFRNIQILCNKLEKWAFTSYLNKAENSQLKWLQGFYIRRVLSSLYENRNDVNVYVRLRCIKSLPLYLYIKHYPVDSLKEHIFKFLLKTKLFLTYDIVRSCVKNLKKRS